MALFSIAVLTTLVALIYSMGMVYVSKDLHGVSLIWSAQAGAIAGVLFNISDTGERRYRIANSVMVNSTLLGGLLIALLTAIAYSTCWSSGKGFRAVHDGAHIGAVALGVVCVWIFGKYCVPDLDNV